MNYKKPEDRQEESLVFRISSTDKEYIRKEADANKVSMSVVVRAALIEANIIPRPYKYQ